jgi:hypothetical protein
MHKADDASSTAHAPFVERLLSEFHNAFRGTGNPTFAWYAIDNCNADYWGHRTDIPEWCLPTIFDAAHAIVALSRQMELPPGGTPAARRRELKRLWAQLPTGLGLSSKGKNQLTNAASALRKIRTAKEYHLHRAAVNLTAKQALDAAKQASGRAPSGNTLSDDRDPDEDRAIHATVAEGGGGSAPEERRFHEDVLAKER